MGTQHREVWVLGSKSLNADRNIQWNDLPYSNFHEPDVLVIDLDSLDEGILQRINKTKFEAARNQIFAKFINGGTVIYIISQRRETIREDLRTAVGRKRTVKVHTRYSNYYLSPIEFQIRTTEGTRIRSYKNEFSPYFKFVKKFSYYLHNFEMSSSLNDLEASDDFVSTIAESLRLRSSVRKDSSKDRLELVTNDIALDNSNHTLSAICSLKVDGYWQSGNAIYLPPTTEISVEESLDVLLQIYGKTTAKETFPEWTYKIELPHMKAVDLKIMNLRKKKVDLEERINTANKQKFELENHYRLLVSKGRALEGAVYEAFKELGFEEIDKKRSIDKEDWVFEFRILSNYKYGVIEVKGTDSKTGIGDLRQCENWASDYLQEYNANAKGVFIPNQYRREEYPDNRTKRLHFEPNEKEYAEQRDVCIIPSCILFEAIINRLPTDKNDRKHMENMIASSKGVLNKLT